MFKPVPKPPSRPQSHTRSSKDDESNHQPKKELINALPLYLNGVPNKLNLRRSQSPDPRDIQPYKRIRRIQSTPRTSVRAAEMFAVKNRIAPDTTGDCKVHQIFMNDVASTDLVPSMNADVTETNRINIVTKTGELFQIFFFQQHEQDILLAFLQAYLSRKIIKIRAAFEMNKSADILERSESSKTFDMEYFEANAVQSRCRNESLWERLRRQIELFLSRTEEFCFCGKKSNDYICTTCSEKGCNTAYTEMELDDGFSLNRDLSDIDESSNEGLCEIVYSGEPKINQKIGDANDGAVQTSLTIKQI